MVFPGIHVGKCRTAVCRGGWVPVDPIYNKNMIIWQITLHAITKETAQEAEAPDLPVPAAAIDADRERLTKVQDRIIWLAAHRHGIAIKIKDRSANEEKRKELFNEGLMLVEEQKEKIDEEAELRRALEAAGIQVLTTEERAKERLETIRAHRAEIAEADQKTRVFEDLDEEDEILAADEVEVIAYLDAAAKAESEPLADSEEAPDDKDGTENADNTDGAEEPPKEDRSRKSNFSINIHNIQITL